MQTDRWTLALEENTIEYAAAFGGLSGVQLNWKPGADRWSIGQIIDHVITTNSAYFPVIDGLHAGTYTPHFAAKFQFLVNFFGKTILRSVQPETQHKTKTLPPFEPRQSGIPEDIVGKFAWHQARLIREIGGAASILDKVVSSPASRIVVYRLDRAFDILVAHERRHLVQAKAVKAQLPTT